MLVLSIVFPTLLLQTVFWQPSSSSFFNPHSRFKTIGLVFWQHGFRNRDFAAHFISTGSIIGREQVVFGTHRLPRTSVMSWESNVYSLFEFLEYFQEYRGSHVIVLMFSHSTDLNKAQWTLKRFNWNWIWLQVAISQGPNGDKPTMNSTEFYNEIKLGHGRWIWIVYEMTTKPIEPYGYTEEQFDEFMAIPFGGPTGHLTSLVSLDIIHLSHTDDDVLDRDFFKKMQYIILVEKPNTAVWAINIEAVLDFIKSIGFPKFYLDVSPIVREHILKNFKGFD